MGVPSDCNRVRVSNTTTAAHTDLEIQVLREVVDVNADPESEEKQEHRGVELQGAEQIRGQVSE